MSAEADFVVNPNSGEKIGILERHHVDTIMPATDMGTEPPDDDDRTLKIWNSFPSNPDTELGQLDKAYGFKLISQLTKSLPFGKEKLAGLLFEEEQELKDLMVQSITEENKRQLEGRSVQPKADPRYANVNVDSVLADGESLTPEDAEIKPSWSKLRK